MIISKNWVKVLEPWPFNEYGIMCNLYAISSILLQEESIS